MSALPVIPEPKPEPKLPVAVSAFSSLEAFEGAQRMAKLLASSDLVPAQYRGNLANTVIALEMAQRMGASPLAVMQQLYVVHGKPAWSAQFLIGQVNALGRFSSLRYTITGEGQDRACTAWAVETATGQRLDGPTVTIAMAKAEGWTSKQGSKWSTMPDLMLRYRAATFWARTYAPELSLGFATAEEIQDLPEPAPVTGVVIEGSAGPATVTDLNARLRAPVAPTWPQKQGDDWIDADGQVFDREAHGWNADEKRPSVTAEGRFRARRTSRQARTASSADPIETAFGEALDGATGEG